MSAAAQQTGPKYYAKPQEYKGMVMGLEKFSECMPEFLVMGFQEWEEVGDDKKFGKFDPDVERILQYEQMGAVFIFTVRDLHTMTLEGYIAMSSAPSLKQKGKLIVQESGVYFQPSARKGRPWLMRKLVTYMENFFRAHGVHALELGHRPHGDPRIGKFYERCGYFQSAVAYYKVLTDA